MTPSIPLQRVSEIPSTSQELRRRAAEGAGEQALMADRQTAGTGRLGREWVSPSGNLALSVLLRPAGAIAPGHWSLMAAVCVAEVAAAVGAGPGLTLKWPNDVMLDGGKLAGILLEAGADAAPWLVIGVGVNLVGAPEGLGRATASLADRGVSIGAEAFARRLLASLGAWREQYAAEGFGPVRAAWMALGPREGSAVVAGGTPGLYAGVREDGALLMRVGNGVVAVTSGEVS